MYFQNCWENLNSKWDYQQFFNPFTPKVLKPLFGTKATFVVRLWMLVTQKLVKLLRRFLFTNYFLKTGFLVKNNFKDKAVMVNFQRNNEKSKMKYILTGSHTILNYNFEKSISNWNFYTNYLYLEFG